VSEVGDLENQLGWIETEIEEHTTELEILRAEKAAVLDELRAAIQRQDIDSNE